MEANKLPIGFGIGLMILSTSKLYPFVMHFSLSNQMILLIRFKLFPFT